MRIKLALAGIIALALYALGAPASLADNRAAVLALDNYFAPRAITVKAGTTVTWMNQGAYPHTVTADNGAFDSGTMNTGSVYSLTFNAPGTYRYYCRFHGAAGGIGMSGVVIVTDSVARVNYPSGVHYHSYYTSGPSTSVVYPHPAACHCNPSHQYSYQGSYSQPWYPYGDSASGYGSAMAQSTGPGYDGNPYMGSWYMTNP